MQQTHRKFGLPYLLYVPARAANRGAEQLPLAVFLHGAGERGRDTKRVTLWGLPKVAKHEPDLPFLVLSPACPPAMRWDAVATEVMALLDEVMAEHDVDPARVYLTGFSMGGAGVLDLALEHPERFAALVPVAAPFPAERAFLASLCRLARIPVWAFHGEADDIVVPQYSRVLAQTLEDCDGRVRLTLYPETGHGEAADEAFQDPDLLAWLVAQRRP